MATTWTNSLNVSSLLLSFSGSINVYIDFMVNGERNIEMYIEEPSWVTGGGYLD